MTTAATASAVRAMPAERTSRLVWWLAALFFLSGASGLIYQVLWVRMLSLSFGITVYVVTVVLASFMGGLALGSFFGDGWPSGSSVRCWRTASSRSPSRWWRSRPRTF